MSNFYKVVSLPEQSTTSTTFVVLTGTTLTFTPTDVSEIWMIFASAQIRSSSTSEQAMLLGLFVNGVEVDLCSHRTRNNNVANRGAGIFLFHRITGTTASQTIDFRYRALTGTARSGNMDIVAALLPSGADFQYIESNTQVQTTGNNVSIQNLTFTPSSAGQYLFMGSAKIREFPNSSTAQIAFRETNGTTLHPNAPTGIRQSNSFDCWSPATYMWRETLSTTSVSANAIFISSNSGTQASQHIYRKMMAFRLDAWANVDFLYDAAQSSTITITPKMNLTTTWPGVPTDMLAITNCRISQDSTSTSAFSTGSLRLFGDSYNSSVFSPGANNTATSGYHNAIGRANVINLNDTNVVDVGDGFTILESAVFFSGNGSNTLGHCAECTIIFLRYPAIPTADGGYHVII